MTPQLEADSAHVSNFQLPLHSQLADVDLHFELLTSGVERPAGILGDVLEFSFCKFLLWFSSASPATLTSVVISLYARITDLRSKKENKRMLKKVLRMKTVPLASTRCKAHQNGCDTTEMRLHTKGMPASVQVLSSSTTTKDSDKNDTSCY